MSLQCDNLSGELQDQWSSSIRFSDVFAMSYVVPLVNHENIHHIFFSFFFSYFIFSLFLPSRRGAHWHSGRASDSEREVLGFQSPLAALCGVVEQVSLNPNNTGASCSKLTTSLVNVSLKFETLILQIHCYFLLKKCENPLHCKYTVIFC